MRTRSLGPAVIAILLLPAACTSANAPDVPRPRAIAAARPARAASVAPVARAAVVLGSGSNVTAVDSVTGAVLFRGSGFVPATARSELLSASPRAGVTVLRAVDIANGAVRSTTEVRWHLAIRVVSGDGSRVAMMAPLPKGASPWVPRPRTFTDIVVADPTGDAPAQRFHIKGNVEPEAFSADRSGLFLIRYLPAEAPTAYRVARLDLEDGDVYPVLGRNKTWTETMTGTRLKQAASADGAGLYTLYSSQPPSYAIGFDPTQAQATRPVAFVHSLNLEEGFAVCVGLPRSLWGGDPDAEAIAVSPDGARVYVVDTVRGVIAEMDTGQLRVIRSVKADLGALGRSHAEAAVSPDGASLFVSRGSSIAAFDTASLERDAVRTTGGEVTALGFSLDGRSMYLAMRGEVAVVDASTGAARGMIPVPNVGPASFVGSIAA